MTKVKVGDYEFEIPDEQAMTGKEIKEAASEKAKEPIDGVPYLRRGNTDLVIKDDEAVVLRPDDQIGFVRPFETANSGSRIASWGIIALLAGAIISFPVLVEASFFYHATRGTVAKRILAKGVNPAKFRGNARFGKKFYASSRPSTAVAEKGEQSAVLRFKTHKNLGQKAIDLRNPTASKLRSLLGKIKLQGKIKNKIIGPKLGHKLGQVAEKKDKVILYRSAKTGKTNLAISEKTLKEHPQIARPEKIVQQSLR